MADNSVILETVPKGTYASDRPSFSNDRTGTDRPSVDSLDGRPSLDSGPDLDAIITLNDEFDQFFESDEDGKEKQYTDTSLFCFKLNNPIRQKCISIVQSKYAWLIVASTLPRLTSAVWPSSWFRFVMLGVILLNIIYYALVETPSHDKNGTPIGVVSVVANIFFIVVFWVEMLIKLIALGFVEYIRHGWNVLDLLLNLYSIISLFPIVWNLSIIRAFRALSTIRVFRSLPGLKAIVDALVFSIPHLLDIGLLMLFIFMVYGLTGMQMWLGTTRQRCLDDATGAIESVSRLCSVNPAFGRQCPTGYTCSINGTANPGYGFTSFDNIALSMLTLFTMSSTNSGWSSVMYYIQDVDGFLTWIFFVSFVVICTFLAINMVIAVITAKYQEYSKKDNAEKPKPSPHIPQAPKEEEDTRGVRAQLRTVIRSRGFNLAVSVAVLINTIFLACDHYGISSDFESAIKVVNTIFTFAFVLEILVKLFALGPKKFFSRAWEIFDFLVVLASLAEFVVLMVYGQTTLVNVLRTLRLLRIFDIVPLPYSMERVMRTVVDFKTSGYLMLIILFFTFIFALIGRQMFAGKMQVPGEPNPRFHFDNLWQAFLTTFQIMTGDNWNDVMYHSMRQSLAGAFFFIVTYGLGAIVLVRLFTGILLYKFSSIPDKVVKRAEGAIQVVMDHQEETQYESDAEDMGEKTAEDLAAKSSKTYNVQKITIRGTDVSLEKEKAAKVFEGKSLRLFDVENPIRKICIKVFASPSFEYILFVLITINCVFLALDSFSVDPTSILYKVIKTQDIIFVVIYSLEILGKVIAFGLVQGNTAYLRLSKGWNILDVIVVVLSIVSLIFPAIAAIRALRALRILRILSRFEGSKVATRAVVSTLPIAGNVAIVVGVLWVVFAILGVNLFKGAFWHCNDPAIVNGTDCIGWFIDTATQANTTRVWENAPFHFDNVGAALLTLFQVAGLSQAAQVMYSAIDATEIGVQPMRDAHPENAIYFIIFILVGSFFALNLLTGAVIDNFSRMKNRFKGSAFLTGRQQKWITTQKILLMLRPSRPMLPPKDSKRVVFFHLVNSPHFNNLMTVIILANVAVLSLRHFNEPAKWLEVTSALNYVFLSLYTLEVMVKMIGLGTLQYFGDASKMTWYKFEFLIVIASYLVIVAGYQAEAPLVRLLRTLPLIRLVRHAARLTVVFNTLLYSLPSLVNIATLLLVIYYVYAIVGIHSLGHIRLSADRNGLNEQANFDDFPHALLTLFRVSTLDNWPSIMQDAQSQTPDCEAQGDCGNYWTWIYFVTFIIIQAYIMLNLVIAVLLENYNEFARVDKYAKWDHFQQFVKIWAEKDPHSTGKIPALAAYEILSQVGPPLGLPKNSSRVEILREFQRMNIPLTRTNKVFYDHLMRAITSRTLAVDLDNLELDDTQQHKFSDYTIAHWWAARCIQRKWRLEAPEVKLRRLGRYDEILDAKKSRMGTLFRALAIINKQDAKLAATTTSGKLELEDILGNETLKQLFTKFAEKKENDKRNVHFLCDVKELETCEDPYRCYQLVFQIGRNYFMQGMKSLNVHTKEIKTMRTEIDTYLASVQHLSIRPRDGPSMSRTSSTRSVASAAASSAARPNAVDISTFNRRLFSNLYTSVQEHVHDTLYLQFLDWDIFKSYCKNQVKSALILQGQNNELIRQITTTQQERDQLKQQLQGLGVNTASIGNH